MKYQFTESPQSIWDISFRGNCVVLKSSASDCTHYRYFCWDNKKKIDWEVRAPYFIPREVMLYCNRIMDLMVFS